MGACPEFVTVWQRSRDMPVPHPQAASSARPQPRRDGGSVHKTYLRIVCVRLEKSEWRLEADQADRMGSSSVSVVPIPTRLRTLTLPPCASMIDLTIANPKPDSP